MERIGPGTPVDLRISASNRPIEGGQNSPVDMYAKSVQNMQMVSITAAQLPALPRADRAALYEHNSDGSFTETSKVPCDNPDDIAEMKDTGGARHFFFTSGEKRKIHLLNEKGAQEMEIGLPGNEAAGQMLYSGREHALFVRTGDALHRIDPGNGQITATLPFGRFGYDRSIGLNADGELMLGSEKKLSVLDGQFGEKSSIELGFRPDTIESLPGGHLFCLDDSCPAKITVFSKKGEKVLEEQNGQLYSTIKGEDGNVYFIGGTSIGRAKPTVLVRFNPATGDVLRAKGTREAESIIPLRNGMMIVFDDRLANPRFIAYDAEGKIKWNVSFEDPGFARQFFLNEDESKAYIVIDKEKCQERCLYEVDLREEPGMLGKMAGSLISAGAKKKPVHLYTEFSDHRGMTPAILDDGRIVIFSEKGIHLLDGKGQEIRQYDTSKSLMNDIRGARALNRPYYIGSGSDFREHDRRNDLIISTINSMRAYNPRIYERIPLERSLGCGTFNEADHTLNWKGSIDENSALAAMSIKSIDEYRNLLEGVLLDKTLQSLVIEDSVNISFAGGNVSLSRDKVNIETPAGKKSFQAENSSHFISALPVTTGRRTFVFAGTDDGMVYWYDAGKGRVCQRYDAGESIRKIVASEKSVLAVTTGGKVLVIEPKLDDDEKFGARLDLSTPEALNDAPGEKVIEDDDNVIIDGMKLEKHHWAHIGGLRSK